MSYTVKLLLAILFFVLIFRDFFSLLKKLKSTSNGKIKVVGICVLTVLATAAAVILLTLFELSLLLAVLLAAWLFRKKLSAFAKNTLCKKNGKLKLAGVSAAAVFALWFGLALFYRTDIGMPIGVKNYLYHKYWEEFEVSGFFGATIAGHPTNQLTCCPKNGDPQTDSFNVARKNTLSVGSRLFASDNYYGVLIREDYENYISTFIDDYFDDFKVYARFDFSGLSNVKYMSDCFDKSTSLQKFLSFQSNEDNIRACNTADLTIILNHQPKIEEEDLIIREVTDIFENLTNNLNYVRMEIITITNQEYYNYNNISRKQFYNILYDKNSSDYISGIRSFVTNSNKTEDIEISDNFFKA
ncbi:MAG: hypothetical protein HDT25_08615 [Ruminococcus sp.]|nr:hypothetical protein [Ruminococcus sp.]